MYSNAYEKWAGAPREEKSGVCSEKYLVLLHQLKSNFSFSKQVITREIMIVI